MKAPATLKSFLSEQAASRFFPQLSSQGMESSSSKEASARQWRPRQYVLVGMGVILAASALIIVTSIVLEPAEISFSVCNFSWITDEMQAVEPESVTFAFNLTAYNPSHRAGMVYRYLQVSMQLKNNGNSSVRETWVPARVFEAFRQPTNSNRTMRVYTTMDNEFFSFYNTTPTAKILVSAQAQFNVGWVRSRTYNVRVGCPSIELASVTQQPDHHDCSIMN